MAVIKISVKPFEVYCDICSEDWSNSNVHGGLIHYNSAVCPKCTHDFKKFKRQTIHCPVELSFRDFVLMYRKELEKKL